MAWSKKRGGRHGHSSRHWAQSQGLGVWKWRTRRSIPESGAATLTSMLCTRTHLCCCRCLFGTTVLTTNEESFFLKNVHKANLNTDGSLNLGICTLHSAGSTRSCIFSFLCGIPPRQQVMKIGR